MLPLRRVGTPVGWREERKGAGRLNAREVLARAVAELAAPHRDRQFPGIVVALTGSRSVIVLGEQNPSRAPTASAPPIFDS